MTVLVEGGVDVLEREQGVELRQRSRVATSSTAVVGVVGRVVRGWRGRWSVDVRREPWWSGALAGVVVGVAARSHVVVVEHVVLDQRRRGDVVAARAASE